MPQCHCSRKENRPCIIGAGGKCHHNAYSETWIITAGAQGNAVTLCRQIISRDSSIRLIWPLIQIKLNMSYILLSICFCVIQLHTVHAQIPCIEVCCNLRLTVLELSKLTTVTEWPWQQQEDYNGGRPCFCFWFHISLNCKTRLHQRTKKSVRKAAALLLHCTVCATRASSPASAHS